MHHAATGTADSDKDTQIQPCIPAVFQGLTWQDRLAHA